MIRELLFFLLISTSLIVMCVNIIEAQTNDSDRDGISDLYDNCLDQPNGPNSGTCMNDITTGSSTDNELFNEKD